MEIIAQAPGARLLLDGKALDPEEPFPGVFRIRMPLPAGQHVIRLESPDASDEVTFYSGPSPPAEGTRPFVDHPPVPIACTHCHGVSRRGRSGSAADATPCHAAEQFIRTHSHEPHEIPSCGMCHEAHGSGAESLLLMAKERACKQCHN